MNCPNCGTNNLDNATICANCGRPLTPAAQTYTPPPSPGYQQPSPITPPPDAGGAAPMVYLILSILMILCCCNPVAVVPLIFGIMTISRKNAGDYAGTALNARRTALWFWISVGALILWYIVFFGFFGGMAILEEMRRGMEQ